jgi:hemerythrin-like domain-containing protein
MTTPIEKLKAEHQIILRGIGLLEDGADRLERGDIVAPEFFTLAIDFIRNYADKYHHAKEEDILFIRMGEHGFTSNSGPIAVMLYEHEKGRLYISNLAQATDQFASKNGGPTLDIIQNARNYAELLRQHIHKEDMVLYPMAENILGAEGVNSMQPAFQKVEEEQKGVEAKYIDLLKKLEFSKIKAPS